jgi:hypothetical protein
MGLGIRSVALLLLLTLLGCQSDKEKEKLHQEEQRRQEVARINHEIADLRSHYNAVVDWPQQLKGKPFSIDVEPIFARADLRPVLFYATLIDVRRQNDAVILYFRTVPTENEPILLLILACAGCDLRSLKDSAKPIDGDFGVIAQVSAVAKSLDSGVDEPEDVLRPEYVLNGKFVDARFVGNYAEEHALAAQ